MSRSLLAAALGAPLLAAMPSQAADRLFVSGRDALVADDLATDLATGQEVARFATPGVSADMVALDSGHILLNHRGGNAVLVVDVSVPNEPRQMPSIRVGAHTGHRDNALTGDGRFLVVPSNVDNVVHVIDTATRQVVRHFPVVAQPNRVAVFGASGASKPSGPMPAAR